MADCRAKGGQACKLQVAFDNECAAMIAGNETFNVTADVTLEKAIASGMLECKSGDNNCHVYFSTCSLPQQIH